MKIKNALIAGLVLLSAVPIAAGNKNKESETRGMLEKMAAIPCGAKQKGITGLGSIWASAGITHLDSNEKLCPEYLLRTDEMEYEIRPENQKHPEILPIGHEGKFFIKKDRMLLSVADSGDHKPRPYQVVAIKPTNSDNPPQAISNLATGKSDENSASDKY